MKKENNKKISLVVIGIIVLASAFYGGMTYGGNNVRASMISRSAAFGGARGNRSGQGMGGFTTGEIISKDDKSITVSLMGGGSKIIFLDTSTKVSKQAVGTIDDLAVGTQVSVTGTPNQDGSLNAQSVQIRTNMPGTVLK
ncbi:MAG TPA: DUF5666 domain-containing protein [Candidatus Paceibacterota bacterium]|nr:DUF5666 domain-containing protein [Candidatus Paceibacterota bacterium]